MIRGRDKKQKALTQLIEGKIPDELLDFIPKRWWFIGDICIISLSKKLFDFKEILGEAFLELEGKKARAVLGKLGPTKDIIRTPDFHHLAGDANTKTIHKELGCSFRIDAAKLTFSPGNHGERKRLLTEVLDDEFIIDMFSCVGNLSLPIAVHKNPKKLIAAEINPLAFKFLEENIKLNKVQNVVEAVFGDNRVVLKTCHNKADRVISGYLHSDERQIREAIKLCKKHGSIHYHQGVHSKAEERDRLYEKLNSIVEDENKRIEKYSLRRVKKYSPGVDHVVVDIIIS